jgi:hypothetical protein
MRRLTATLSILGGVVLDTHPSVHQPTHEILGFSVAGGCDSTGSSDLPKSVGKCGGLTATLSILGGVVLDTHPSDHQPTHEILGFWLTHSTDWWGGCLDKHHNNHHTPPKAMASPTTVSNEQWITDQCTEEAKTALIEMEEHTTDLSYATLYVTWARAHQTRVTLSAFILELMQALQPHIAALIALTNRLEMINTLRNALDEDEHAAEDASAMAIEAALAERQP